MEEHRRAVRMDLDLAAHVEMDGEKRDIYVANLGPDGAFLEADIEVTPGQSLRVSFEINSHPISFEVDAEVRWQKGAGFGVQFRDMSAYDRAALDDFCQRRLEVSRLEQARAQRT